MSVDDEAERPDARETAIVKAAIDEEAVVETAVIVESEVVVAVVSGGGTRCAHHEAGDRCRYDENLSYGVARHRCTPIAHVALTPSSLVQRNESNGNRG
jgi:hypothetical protein